MKPRDTHPVQGACLKSGGMVEKMALLQSINATLYPRDWDIANQFAGEGRFDSGIKHADRMPWV
jgi:hypothetical protein